jgi:hypothetical protein
MTTANRGKYAEGKVRDYLKLLDSAHVNFTFNRNQDAHAAGGRFTPQAGDFQAFGLWQTPAGDNLQHIINVSRNFIIEVKELAHDYRLPEKNYSADKVARVQKRVLAGTSALVLIYHTGLKIWRAVPHDVFRDRSKPSWDLREFEPVDYKRAISDFVGFLP